MTYLVIILAFAIPLIGLQWVIGWPVLLLEWRPLVATVVMATVYLGFADIAGLHNSIWEVNPAKTLGFDHCDFVLEEWILLFATNTLIAQTVILALDVDVRARARSFLWRLRH